MLRTLWRRFTGAPATPREALDAFAPCANCAVRPVLIGHPRCGRCHGYFKRHGVEWSLDAKGTHGAYSPKPRKVQPDAPSRDYAAMGRKGAAAKKAKAAKRARARAAAQVRSGKVAQRGGTKPQQVVAAVAAGACCRKEITELLRCQSPGMSMKAIDNAIWKARTAGQIARTADGYRLVPQVSA